MRVNTASLSLRMAANCFSNGWDLPAFTSHQFLGWMHANRAGRLRRMSASFMAAHLAPSWKELVRLTAASGFSFMSREGGDGSPPEAGDPAGLPGAGLDPAGRPTLAPVRITKPARDLDDLVRGRCIAA